MTRNQSSRVYFPLWSGAFQANWSMDRGVPVLLAQPAYPDKAEEIDRVARAAVHKLHRAVTQDDLRHASHVVFLGCKKSSKDITNDELDRLIACYKLMIDPDNLKAVMDLNNPARAQRRRQVQGIENSGVKEHTLRAWCAHFNGGRTDWRDLPDGNFTRFVGYVWQRVKGSAANKAAAAKPAKASRDFDPYGGGEPSTTFGVRRGD